MSFIWLETAETLHSRFVFTMAVVMKSFLVISLEYVDLTPSKAQMEHRTSQLSVWITTLTWPQKTQTG